jgi:ribonuclease T2
LAIDALCQGQYTIHGLWPDPESSCTSCTTEPFSENNISDATLQDMATYWPNCLSGGNDKFWSHEWSKHGTCSGLSQEDFFSTAISLFNQYINLCPAGQTSCQICFSPSLQLQGLCPV